MTEARRQEAEQVWDDIRRCAAKTQKGATEAIKEVIAVALAKARNDAREEAAKEADDWSANYPIDVWPDPPPGEHGKTIDLCSARAMRYGSKCIAEDIRALKEE